MLLSFQLCPSSSQNLFFYMEISILRFYRSFQSNAYSGGYKYRFSFSLIFHKRCIIHTVLTLGVFFFFHCIVSRTIIIFYSHVTLHCKNKSQVTQPLLLTDFTIILTISYYAKILQRIKLSLYHFVYIQVFLESIFPKVELLGQRLYAFTVLINVAKFFFRGHTNSRFPQQ